MRHIDCPVGTTRINTKVIGDVRTRLPNDAERRAKIPVLQLELGLIEHRIDPD